MDLDREKVQPARGWTDEEWTAAQARVAGRGWLDAAGRATADGRDAFQAVEAATDVAAAGACDALGPAGLRRVTELLTPMARACATILPIGNPIGLAPAP